MGWWIWLVCGFLLAAAEVLSGGELYLLFLGVSAIVVGFLAVAGVTPTVWAQVGAFCVIAAVSLAYFRRKLSARLRGGVVDREVDTLIGERAVAADKIAPGERGKAELRGAVWSVKNVDAREIAAGGACLVEKVEGLTLWVRNEE